MNGKTAGWIGLAAVLALGAGCFRNTVSTIELDVPAMKSEACRQAAFPGDAGQQDAHGIGHRQADTGQRFGSLRLQLIVNADVEHRGPGSHGSHLREIGRSSMYLK